MLAETFSLLTAAWGLSEIVLGIVTRARGPSSVVKDRGSLVLLWIAIGFGLVGGNVIRFHRFGSLAVPSIVPVGIALVLVLAGIVVRWTAILTLGRFFSPNVATHTGQRILRTGVFRRVRHPSYTGVLLCFVGMGVAFENWASFCVLVLPIGAAFLYRMHVEEKALLETFGEEYAEYRKTTKRLVPGIY